MAGGIMSIFHGPPLYQAHSPWGPKAAIAAAAIVLLCQLLVLPWALYEISPGLYESLSGVSRPIRLWGPSLPAFTLAQDSAIIALVWLLSGMRGAKRTSVLSLNPVVGGAAMHIILAGSVFLIMVPLSFAAARSFGQVPEVINFTQRQFDANTIPLFRLTFFISLVVVGPLSEELLFRGFLLSALAQSRIGFWGAAVLTNIMWVLMHAANPSYALFITFLLGLLLSSILWRTGSLWTCIYAHGAYNVMPTLFQLIFVLR